MAGVPRCDAVGDPGWPVDRRPFESPAGLRVLVPGWPQFSWGQRQRGWVLLGSFAGALGAGLLTWGTAVGWSCFAFAFATHVTSITDAIGQGSFPVPRRTATLVVTTGALAVLLYLPALAVLLLTAWPGFAQDRARSGYLVNCWAYHGARPRRGDWVWLRLPPRGRLRAARVVATAGQEVEWTGRRWRVDGQDQPLHAPPGMAVWPWMGHFKIPADQVLVEPEEGASSPAAAPLLLVSNDRIIGRAWAQFYPVWDRRLL